MQIVHNRLRANANSQQSKKYRGITTAKCITTITDKQYTNKSDLLLSLHMRQSWWIEEVQLNFFQDY